MTITLKDYLEHIYPCKCKASRKPKFRETTTRKEYFEIKDLENDNKEPETSIITKENEGESLFYNPKHIATYIVDFEYYINSFKKGSVAASGQKCDFILSAEKDSFIIVNELKEGKEEYIGQPEEEATAQPKTISQLKAIAQLEATIEKLSKDKDDEKSFLSQFRYRIALLSCRNTDPNSKSLVRKNTQKFNSVASMSLMTIIGELSNGFILVRIFYPKPFELPPRDIKHQK